MTPSKSEHPLHETSTKPVAIPMVEKLRSATHGLCSEDASQYVPRGVSAADCSAAADLIEQLVEALEAIAAAAYKRGWNDGCESTLETSQDDPFGRCCVPHKDAMNEGCGDYLAELGPTLSAARGESGK